MGGRMDVVVAYLDAVCGRSVMEGDPLWGPTPTIYSFFYTLYKFLFTNS